MALITRTIPQLSTAAEPSDDDLVVLGRPDGPARQVSYAALRAALAAAGVGGEAADVAIAAKLDAEDARDAAVAARDGSETAQGMSEGARDASVAAKVAALIAEADAADHAAAALAAAEASGDVSFFDSKAAASGAIGGLSEGDIVEVLADEDEADARTRYRVQGGALVLKANLSSSAALTFAAAAPAAHLRTVQDRLRDTVSVKDFGAIGDGTLHTVAEWIVPGALGRFVDLAALQVEYPHVGATTDSIDWAAIQAAVNFVIGLGGGEAFFPRGDFLTNRQLVVTAGPNVRAFCDLRGSGCLSTVLRSSVTGSIEGFDTAGFAVLFDGWQNSRASGLTFEYTNGTAGVALRCRNHVSMNDTFNKCHFRGGIALVAREIATKISVRMIGNEAIGASAGYSTYYSLFQDCHFNFAHKHIEHVVGDGSVNTQQPNCNNNDNCRFDRCIIAIDWGDTDENRATNVWWNNSPGVAGINDGFADFLHTQGSLNYVAGSLEPGANTRPFKVSPNAVPQPAENNVFDLVSNTTARGVDNGVGTVVRDRGRISGVREINNDKAWATDGEADVNFFGVAPGSHAGLGYQAIRVWARNTNTDFLKLGWNTGDNCQIVVPAGNALQLSESWQNPLRLENRYLWVTSGALRMTTSAALPASATDGVPASLNTASATAANFASIAAAVNTTGKVTGLQVWDSTNKRMMRASGATAASPWDVIDGSASVVPA